MIGEIVLEETHYGPETVCIYGSKGIGILREPSSLSSNDFKLLLCKLSCHYVERRQRRKHQRLEGISAILDKLPRSVPVRELVLSGNVEIGDAGMAHLYLLPRSITKLNLGECGLTHTGIKVLCEHLKTNTSIRQLLVWRNNIEDEGANHIADLLRVNRTLDDLNLSSTQIGPNGFICLAEALAVNDTLSSLHLHRNEQFQDEHIQAIFQGLKANRGVTNMSLSDSLKRVTSEGLRSIVECLRVNHYLESLFSGNSLSDVDHVNEDDPAWPEIDYLLTLNSLNRKIVVDEDASLSEWLECVIKSSQKEDVSYSYFFLRNKPELCMYNHLHALLYCIERACV